MKRLACGIFLALLLLPRPTGSQQPLPGGRRTGRDQPLASMPYDQPLIPARVFQRTLPPLDRKEKVIWSLRTSRANAFL